MEPFKGFLIDLDGVLYIEDRVTPGAVEAVNWLRQQGYPLRFLTNTTMWSRDALVRKLMRLGIQAESGEMFSTAAVAAKWLADQGVSRVQLLLTEDAQKDFAGFEITTRKPEVVVVGDLGATIRFDILNHAFLSVKAGARLVALQKGRYWQTKNGLALDAGAFVAALEYATESEAELIGKPNPTYFNTALADLGIDPSRVAMIGDDILMDIGGAQAIGMSTILVLSGKYAYDSQPPVSVKPDWTLDSIADLPGLIRENDA